MENKHKGLSAGHLTMMALGSVIGGSFFLGTSVAMNAAGPSILVSFILAGVLVYFILFALSEMTVADPYGGSFSTFAAEELGEGTGFVVGWVYWTGTIFSMSSEATAIPILLRQWFPHIPLGLSGTIIIIGVTLLNLLGSHRLSKLESGLSSIKLLAIVFFIILGIALIIGIVPGMRSIGAGELVREPLMPGGIQGIAGSMLIVIFAYAGFEIIGLAASEAANPLKTIPKAIAYTVLSLVGLYILYAAVLMPLVPTAQLSDNVSPMVMSLNRQGILWASSVLNGVLISASLSAMLAAVFGLGRMIRALTYEGHAPKWLEDNTDVPYRGIIFSGFAMLLGLGFGHLFPRVYLVLITSGGFALLFTYAVIMACHIRFRRKKGCPPDGKCQMPGYPYTSWFTLICMILVFISMPFIPGQSSGLVTGVVMVIMYFLAYRVMKLVRSNNVDNRALKVQGMPIKQYQRGLSTEFSEELMHKNKTETPQEKKRCPKT